MVYTAEDMGQLIKRRGEEEFEDDDGPARG